MDRYRRKAGRVGRAFRRQNAHEAQRQRGRRGPGGTLLCLGAALYHRPGSGCGWRAGAVDGFLAEAFISQQTSTKPSGPARSCDNWSFELYLVLVTHLLQELFKKIVVGLAYIVVFGLRKEIHIIPFWRHGNHARWRSVFSQVVPGIFVGLNIAALPAVFTQNHQDFVLAGAGKVRDYLDVFLQDAAATEELHIIGAEGENGLAAKCRAAQQDCAKGYVRSILHQKNPPFHLKTNKSNRTRCFLPTNRERESSRPCIGRW